MISSPLREKTDGTAAKRTERDLPITVVLAGCVGLVVIMAALPFVPGTSVLGKLVLGIFIVVFGCSLGIMKLRDRAEA